MADSTLALVEFHGDTLLAFQTPDGVFVAVNPICRSLGISARSQQRRIENDLILAEGRAVMALPPSLTGQETVCLRLDLISGWLLGIDARRVHPDVRDKVLAYQRECYRVLYRHFFPAAGDPAGRPAELDPATEAWGNKLRLVAECRLAWGERVACQLWLVLGLPQTSDMVRPRQGELPL
jgi:hypothetical protein